jgi:hypothetical protein
MSIESSRSLAEVSNTTLRQFQRCRWKAGRRRDIIVEEGCRFF